MREDVHVIIWKTLDQIRNKLSKINPQKLWKASSKKRCYNQLKNNNETKPQRNTLPELTITRLIIHTTNTFLILLNSFDQISTGSLN